MKKYLTLIRMEMRSGFRYKVSTYAGICVGIIQIFVMFYIWNTIYSNSYKINGYTKKEVITYMLLSSLIYRVIELGISLRIADLVRSGDISLKIVQPVALINSLLFQGIGVFISRIITVVIPIAIIGLIFFEIIIINNPIQIAMFIISIFFSVLISVMFDIICGFFSFWTTNGWGIRVFREGFIKLFSGALIPIAFLPYWLRVISNGLPFKSLIDLPLNIYLHNNVYQSGKALLIQILWFIALAVCASLLYKKIITKIDINGG